MKLSKLTDLDLTQYRLAYFHGDSLNHSKLCQNDVMALVEGGGDPGYDITPLQIALIPLKARLTDCNGDDWNDVPSDSNASGFYQCPKGTVFLQGILGGELRQVEKFG